MLFNNTYLHRHLVHILNGQASAAGKVSAPESRGWFGAAPLELSQQARDAINNLGNGINSGLYAKLRQQAARRLGTDETTPSEAPSEASGETMLPFYLTELRVLFLGTGVTLVLASVCFGRLGKKAALPKLTHIVEGINLLARRFRKPQDIGWLAKAETQDGHDKICFSSFPNLVERLLFLGVASPAAAGGLMPIGNTKELFTCTGVKLNQEVPLPRGEVSRLLQMLGQKQTSDYELSEDLPSGAVFSPRNTIDHGIFMEGSAVLVTALKGKSETHINGFLRDQYRNAYLPISLFSYAEYLFLTIW